MNVKIGTYNLAGDSWSEKVSEIDIGWSRDVAVQKHFRASYPTIRQGYNQVANITFNVARLHKDYRTAAAFILDHGDVVPRSGTVKFEDQLEGGKITRTFAYGVMVSLSGKIIGVSTLHNYQMIGTQMAQAATVRGLSAMSTSPSSGGSTVPSTPAAFDVFANRAELKATISTPVRRFVFLTEPEDLVQRVYQYKHGDTSTADDISIIAPTDNRGRYFQMNL